MELCDGSQACAQRVRVPNCCCQVLTVLRLTTMAWNPTGAVRGAQLVSKKIQRPAVPTDLSSNQRAMAWNMRQNWEMTFHELRSCAWRAPSLSWRFSVRFLIWRTGATSPGHPCFGC